MAGQDVTAAPSGGQIRFSLRGALVALTLAAGAIYLAGLLWSRVGSFPIPEVEPRPFDAGAWKAWSEKDMMQSEDIRRAFGRLDMRDDLLAKHNFSGWTRQQLTGLLGPPDPKYCPKGWDIGYLLGMEWIDDQMLVFRMDSNDTVTSYRVFEY